MMESEPKSRTARWRQNPDAVRKDILKTATQVFAEHGLSGARVDEIVQRTQTSKRMIYYYFEDKSTLFLAVLEAAYARVREGEENLNLEELDPISALTQLVEFTFDYHCANPDYVRLIAIENIHNAENLSKSQRIPRQNLAAIDKLRNICDRGVQAGLFRPDTDPVALHWLITSSCFFNVSNRATFGHLYGDDVYSEAGQSDLRRMVSNAVLSAVRA